MDKQPPTSIDTRVAPAVTVKVDRGTLTSSLLRFSGAFTIGRGDDCDVVLAEKVVSKVHAKVFFEKDRWWLQDQGSMNGLYFKGKRTMKLPLRGRVQVSLGIDGPLLTFEAEDPAALEETVPATPSLSEYVDHYFRTESTRKPGEHTLMLRKAFQLVNKKKSRRYLVAILILGVLFAGAAGYAIYKRQQINRQYALASDVFYKLKSLELAYTALEKRIPAEKDPALESELSSYLERRRELTATYDRFVNELGIYHEGMDQKERIIYHVARMFGECEVNMPKEFADEVMSYVDLWKRSPRLVKAIARAEDHGYPDKIARAMLSVDMPPQFFYLALQESEFDSTVCGPPTRYGIAKGMWQFMPSTAIAYGLKTGPLVELPRPDPRDERHNVDRSTQAAARYLRDIYNTDAQASGLLVIASYNWGQNVVRGLIRKMPENPRDRNFWKFLAQYKDKLPKQTYDYVFYIFSAAVIGENPRLFGFSFAPPFPSPEPDTKPAL
jgi:pSer/pThr/pTyr-binding forkhead associated (FHA) protein